MDARPYPPAEILEEVARSAFVPAPELGEWVEAKLIDEAGDIANEDHAHLRQASIGWLWTNEPNSRHGRVILGQAEKMPPMAMGKWTKARLMAQLEQWFGDVPDFLITLDGGRCAELDDASFLALVEHELYHCGQERDLGGAPKFTQAGAPVWTIRGHDIEEFVGVVRRYGAVAAGVEQLVEAAAGLPEIARAEAMSVCGNCLKAAA